MAQTFGAVVGYVSKVTNGPLSYVARSVEGINLGYFNSVGEAKRVLMQSVASGRLLTWTREDMSGSIESYTATVGH
jgi:hypothetical protein